MPPPPPSLTVGAMDWEGKEMGRCIVVGRRGEAERNVVVLFRFLGWGVGDDVKG